MAGMAALIATRKAAWADALELQPPPPQPTTGPSQLKLKVLAAGLAFPDVPAPNWSRLLAWPHVWLFAFGVLDRFRPFLLMR